MSTMDWVFTALGLVTLLTGSFLVIRSAAIKANQKAQKELIDTLLQREELRDKALKELQEQRIESDKKTANLAGQVDILKNIPLKEIATAQIATAAEMKEIAKTQRDILELLPKSSGGGNGKSQGN